MTLDGARVAVTGGAGGIGGAVAARFAAAGAQVTIVDRDAAAAGTVAAGLPGADAAGLDVTDAAAVEAFFAGAAPAYGIVVVNAGVGSTGGNVTELGDDEWRRVLGVNLDGAFHTLRSAARRMVADGLPGRIIVTASVAGTTAEPGHAAYAVSKWGVIGLLKSAALELAPHGVLVNGVCPGDVRTPLLGDFVDDDAYSGALGRLADPDEVAGAYVWLAGPDARYMVGETVTVDAGLSISALIH